MRIIAFLRNNVASIAMIWGVSLIVIVPLIGLSYDYYALTRQQEFLQNTLDGAALRASRLDSDPDTIQYNTNQYIQEALALNPAMAQEVQVNSVTMDITTDGQEYNFTLTGQSQHAPIFENIFGRNPKLVVDNVVAKVTNKPIEVVLVLDVSGSMRGRKLEDLKKAAKKFVGTLLAQNKKGNVSIGVVPYSAFVNIKTVEPDYLGNQHNWNISADEKDIITSLKAVDLRDQKGWDKNRRRFGRFYTGNMWRYMDVEQHNIDVNGRYIDGALHNGEMDDGWNSDFTTVTDGRTYSAGYSPQQFISYRINSAGNYMIYDRSRRFPGSINTRPNSVNGTYHVYNGQGPFAHDTLWGINDHVGKGVRTLPVWNNHFWLQNLSMQPWSGCVMARYWSDMRDHDLLDEEPTKLQPQTLFVPALPDYFAASNGNYNTQVGVNAYGFYSGSKDIRSPQVKKYASYEVRPYPDVAAYYINHTLNWKTGYSYFPFAVSGGCPEQPLMPLQQDEVALKRYIDALTISGYTNTTEGIKWGWNLLSPQGPFIAGLPYGSGKKIMIVITDGENYYGGMNSLGSSKAPMGYTGSATDRDSLNKWLDQKMLKLCTNVKNANQQQGSVQLYTLAVEMSQLHSIIAKKCASSAEHFFDVQSSSQLEDALEQIMQSIFKLYISD